MKFGILKKNWIIILITVIFFIIPFFWLKPQELELGGDSSRLYLYNPIEYIKADGFYSIAPEGLGIVRPDQDLLPFLLLLEGIYALTHSPFLLTSLLNAAKLSGSFIFTYLSLIELLRPYRNAKNEKVIKVAGTLAGIFYALSPSVGRPIQFALLIHNQVFLNPMIFYLLLRFSISEKWKDLWLLLIITFIFAPNFSLKAPTAPFAFYPFVLFFLLLYTIFCLKKSLPWKKIAIGVLFFLGLHAFHLIPVTLYTFDPGSEYNIRVFNTNSIQDEGLNYFNAVLPYAMVTRSFFYTYLITGEQWAIFIAPLCIIFGFLLAQKNQKDFLLIAIFFFITTFLESANITQIGVSLYRQLFHIPGFSMFRNFAGQWQWIQDFFYTLLLGYSLFFIFSKLKRKFVYIISIGFAILMLYTSWPYWMGQLLRQPHRATQNVSSIIIMDSQYKKTLAYINALQVDGKIFDFPFTEFGYQVVPGINNGAYIGPSTIGYLTGKKDFSGQQILYPFSDTFLSLIKQKNYLAIKQLFGLLNIKYIYFNADSKAYRGLFSSIPFTLLLQILPTTQSLEDFVGHVVGNRIFQAGKNSIYESDPAYYLPHIYIPISMIPFEEKNDWMGQNTSFFVSTNQNDPRVMYIDRLTCQLLLATACKQKDFSQIPTLSFEKITPTKYVVTITNAKSPFFLIFSDKFHKDWHAYIKESVSSKKVIIASYFNDSIKEEAPSSNFFDANPLETLILKQIPQNKHFMINGYANAWYITPQAVGGKINYQIILDMTQQRIVYTSMIVSILTFFIFLACGIILWTT